jgi:hypothetical protein
MNDPDMPRGEFFRRLGAMLALNFATVLAMTSPLWLTTALRRAQTYWTIAAGPGAPAEEVEARLCRFRAPGLHEALWQDAALATLPYLAWVLAIHLAHRARAKPATRSDRLKTWAAAGRFRIAYLLFWPIPFFTLLVLAFLEDFLRVTLQPSGEMDRILRTAWRWYVTAWWPTMPVLAAIGLLLAVRGVRRNLHLWRRRALPLAHAPHPQP